MAYKMAAALLNKQARGSNQFPKILTFIFKICFICEFTVYGFEKISKTVMDEKNVQKLKKS